MHLPSYLSQRRQSYLYNHNWIPFSRPNITIYNSECVYVRWLSDNKKIYAVQSSFWNDLSVENNYITIETLLYFAHCGVIHLMCMNEIPLQYIPFSRNG